MWSSEQPAHATGGTCWRSGLKYPEKLQAEGSCKIQTSWQCECVCVFVEEGKWEEQKSKRRPLFLLHSDDWAKWVKYG